MVWEMAERNKQTKSAIFSRFFFNLAFFNGQTLAPCKNFQGKSNSHKIVNERKMENLSPGFKS